MNIKYIKTTDNKKYDLRDKRITDTDTGIATQSANGLLSSGDKKKLDGIASGAEVNQNAFSNIKIGNTTILADGKTDTVELTAGNNITLTPDATNDKITIAATDTNTTYTFKGGTNQFTVTPSNGTAQTVSVTPSIANNVTGSDLTANTIILGNGNSGVKKSGKTIVTTLGSDDTTLPTSKAVKAAIDALPEPMIFKGTLGKDGTITSLPAAAASNEGYTYKVITDGKYAQQSAKTGDVFISNGSSWNLIPSGDEPSGTVTNIATGTGLTGGPITTSGTISHADTSSQASVSNSGRTYIQSVTLDGMGHVTGLSSATETVVNTDRYVNNAAFADDSTSTPASPVKMTLTRAGSDTATVTANLPKVSSASAGVAPKGAAVTTQSQSTKFLREDGTWAAPSYTKPGGDVTGPSSSTDAHVAVFDGATGKVIKDSSFTIGTSVPSNAAFTDTDMKVRQSLTSSDWDRPLLMSYQSNTVTSTVDNVVFRNNSIYANPSTGTITANKFNGNASSASKLTTNAGSATQPVYFSGGVPTACSYQLNKTVPSNAVFTDTTYSSKSEASGGTDVSLVTTGEKYTWNHKSNLALGNTASTALPGNTKYAGSSTQGGAATSAEKLTNTSNIGNTNQPVYFTASGVPDAISYTIGKSVPSNAKFTDTHYTTHLYAGSGTAANAATANGNTKLTIVDNTTTRDSVTIKGTGGTTVTSDANGVVTIDSVNKNSKWFNFYSPSKVDNAYYFIISPIGGSTVTPSGTCYSIEINAVVQSSPGNYIVSNTKFVIWCYWYASNAGLRITYPVYSNSKIPIYYHNKAEGAGIGNETRSSNVCNIPIKVENVESLAAVNIKVDGPGVSDCICNRSYSSFNWGQDEPTSWSSI